MPDITKGINIAEEFGGPADVAARWGEYIPLLNDIFTGEDEIQAKVVMDSLGIDIERAFAKNPRFPEGEVKRLKKLVPKGGVFSTLSATVADLKGLQTTLAMNLYNEEKTGRDPSLSPKTQGEARENAVNIQNLVTKIGQILDAARQFSQADLEAEAKRRWGR